MVVVTHQHLVGRLVGDQDGGGKKLDDPGMEKINICSVKVTCKRKSSQSIHYSVKQVSQYDHYDANKYHLCDNIISTYRVGDYRMIGQYYQGNQSAKNNNANLRSQSGDK